MASMIDGFLTLAGGIYACLIGWEIVPISKDPAREAAWRKRWGLFFKIGGPIIILSAVVTLIRAAGRN